MFCFMFQMIAAHNVVLKKFPNCKLVCCNFHLGQNRYRRIQQNKPLFNKYLNKSSEIGAWLKSLILLIFLGHLLQVLKIRFVHLYANV